MDPIHDSILFQNYLTRSGQFDEVFARNNSIKPVYSDVIGAFSSLSPDEYRQLNEFAKKSFLSQGITFATYNQNPRGIERIFPFDLLPRIIHQQEWGMIERGMLQRAQAMDLFLHDLYNGKKILKDKIIPVELIHSSNHLCKFMEGFTPPGSTYCHISGTDLIRHADGEYYILEDNLRCPSGVSYVLANREAMKKTFSQLFKQFNVASVMNYPSVLLEVLQSVCPAGVDEPVCVLLTPGVYNSAYYEHSFLAQSMGVELVEGRDLYVDHDFVYMNTVYGPEKVDVVYRRIDDDFMDPLVFRTDSVLGVPGIMSAYRKGNVTLVNAPGTGVADDKAVYTYVPDIIRYYLDQEPILQNVPTMRCGDEKDRQYVLEHLPELVVKPVDQSGGYGVFIGQNATREELDQQKQLILASPREYIAQPIMALSLHATFIEQKNQFEPRHIDLRTFTLKGKDVQYVLSGGLSRVALKEGSLIVNSSQGGGSKDTWIVND
ncbi:MAG TPA: circularly permuted type 2 ATP-grasp protein [Saprospiraceae bacterium]|nr:circularly permuted type 2 ATP-grasp protein [Saprospiraceae bacterium]HPG07384.1 circularly permuted type 2 ATP-grasp protein [Saprospiraceae bacterium]HPQ99713.1 circularly permuted type 2 ATP-grasp protein [Saprospiraceae bacterium]HQU52137.1 circularly permuted type 2 ATP-grasp protein [Saprospiraceae bacterium]HRV86468.1 circularly permuted type 2 ATP-grasp protein [Saprospiraceae bacterium]